MGLRKIAAGAAALLTVVGAALSADVPQDAWRDVAPENLILIDTRYGEIAVELAPDFAPAHAARLKAMVRAHAFDAKAFYRVIDGFVAQGGLEEETAAQKAKWPPLKAEFDRPAGGLRYAPLGSKDLYAQDVGHIDGFPIGVDMGESRAWIVHCPGTFAFARDNDADSASTEFYIVIGEAPRRLDRNLTAFGRVIWGMPYVQKLIRGDAQVNEGVIAKTKPRDAIIRMRVAADMPARVRPHFQVVRTETAYFADLKKAKMYPGPGFLVRAPPPVLDICAPLVQVRKLR